MDATFLVNIIIVEELKFLLACTLIYHSSCDYVARWVVFSCVGLWWCVFVNKMDLEPFEIL